MPNKALRILIADPQHTHRVVLERLFNQLGYFRIVPVSHLQELLTLVEYGSEPFDLVVINAGMASGALDLHDFVIYNPQVRHGWVYNAPATGVRPVPVGRRSSMHWSLAPLPDLASLRGLMARVDVQVDASQAPLASVLRQAYGS